ncbi:hypothetical protein PM082_012785 [Marasmius tenuissimus]|nr:hypothetical protein PM082_012785 [Marasmius tenuissimus]
MNTSTPSTAPASSTTDPQEPRNTAMQLVESPTTSPSSPPPPMATAIVDSPPVTAASSPPPVATTMPTSPQNQNQTQRPAQESVDTPPDPRIASLKAMFPDFDDTLLLSVLQSAGGNEDRSIDTLLGMSDPDYRSDARPQEPVLTELDEQFARQLYMQDEQQYHRQRAQWEAQQPRPQPARQSSQDKDVMTEVSEQFKNIAETGRKTFGNIFSKVKAKISEYDQQRQPQGQSSSQGNYYGPSAAHPVNTTQPPSNQQYQAYHQDSLSQSQAQQPAFYDPNPQPSSPTGRETPPPQQSPPPPKEPQGYDVFSSSSSAAETQTPAPPATGSGTGLEKGKLGLLPKRPVSLLAQSPPQSTTNTKPSKQDSDDELEYVENPFEDNAGRK